MTAKIKDKETILNEIFIVLQADYDSTENNPSSIKSDNTSTFDSIRIIDKAKTISKEETILLKKIALIREDALELMRNNDLSEGFIQLQKSTDLTKNKRLSEEAFLIHSTYHFAAESFLSIKKKEYIKALELMQGALEEHKKLFVKFGHAIESRRVHLGRNISKILELSDKKIEALQLSLQLLEYSILEQSKWPLDECQIGKVDKVSLPARMFTINQLLKSINSILIGNQTEELVNLLESSISKLKEHQLNDYIAILNWLQAHHATIKNDEIAFLENALLFFNKSHGLLPDASNSIMTIMEKRGLF